MVPGLNRATEFVQNISSGKNTKVDEIKLTQYEIYAALLLSLTQPPDVIIMQIGSQGNKQILRCIIKHEKSFYKTVMNVIKQTTKQSITFNDVKSCSCIECLRFVFS